MNVHKNVRLSPRGREMSERRKWLMPDGCGRHAVLLAVERWYDFPGFGDYSGNVGLMKRGFTVRFARRKS